LAVVATLSDVVGVTDRNGTRHSWHRITLKLFDWPVKKK
jgi:hypothetical protein